VRPALSSGDFNRQRKVVYQHEVTRTSTGGIEMRRVLCLLVLLSGLVLVSSQYLACGTNCSTLTSCLDCVQEQCVWVEWEGGGTECIADRDDVPPADAAIHETVSSCSDEAP
jgi:hypothetical protein